MSALQSHCSCPERHSIRSGGRPCSAGRARRLRNLGNDAASRQIAASIAHEIYQPQRPNPIAYSPAGRCSYC